MIWFSFSAVSSCLDVILSIFNFLFACLLLLVCCYQGHQPSGTCSLPCNSEEANTSTVTSRRLWWTGKTWNNLASLLNHPSYNTVKLNSFGPSGELLAMRKSVTFSLFKFYCSAFLVVAWPPLGGCQKGCSWTEFGQRFSCCNQWWKGGRSRSVSSSHPCFGWTPDEMAPRLVKVINSTPVLNHWICRQSDPC